MSATQAQLTAVYDLENIVPSAVSTVLAAPPIGLVVATYASTNELQKARPRVEILWANMGESVPRRSIPVQYESGVVLINAAYKGQLHCSVITDSADSDKVIHQNYVTNLRWYIPQLGGLCNATILPTHKLQFQREGGTAFMHKTDDGFTVSTITFDVDVSIQQDALTALINS
jgi:hypothetical protein